MIIWRDFIKRNENLKRTLKQKNTNVTFVREYSKHKILCQIMSKQFMKELSHMLANIVIIQLATGVI